MKIEKLHRVDVPVEAQESEGCVMNSKELRIGSYYAIDGVVRRLMYDDMRDALINEVRITPIPLDEEWLLKFGLEEDGPGYYEITKSVAISIDNHVYSGRHLATLQLQYVHQLQNLYFALTDKEL